MGNYLSRPWWWAAPASEPEPEVEVRKERKSKGARTPIQNGQTRSSFRLQLKRECRELFLSQSTTRELRPRPRRTNKVPLSAPASAPVPRSGSQPRQRRLSNQEKLQIKSQKKGYFRRLKDKKEKERYLCSQCGKDYSSKDYLKDHERIHTGIKKFRCEWCLKKFYMRASYRQHVTSCERQRKAGMLTFGNWTAQKANGSPSSVILKRCDNFGSQADC